MTKRSLAVLLNSVQQAQSSKNVRELYECAHELTQIGSSEATALALYASGVAAYCLGDYPQALESYNTALALYEESNNSSGVAMVTGNIGVVVTLMELPRLQSARCLH